MSELNTYGEVREVNGIKGREPNKKERKDDEACCSNPVRPVHL